MHKAIEFKPTNCKLNPINNFFIFSGKDNKGRTK